MSMRICLLPLPTIEPPIGGVQNCTWGLARALTKLGHQIVPEPAMADIFHGHAFDGSIDVYTSHGIYPPDHQHASSNGLLFANIASADRVTAVSRWTADQISFTGAEPTVIHNGVDLDVLSKYQAPFSNYVLWGKVSADELSNPGAFVELAIRHPELRFVMTAAPQGVILPGNLRVIGLQPFDKMMNWIAGAQALVSTGTENFPIQALEAMALGTPVIALPRGGIKEIRGISIDDDLSSALEKVIARRSEYSKIGREAVSRYYTWDRIAKQYLEVYEQSKRVDHSGRVSVVIPCYNLADKLERAIDSCLQQTKQPDEIIVVDDGSTQGSVSEVVRPYGRQVKFIHQDNAGVAAARNRGIKEASSEYICCLDADDSLSRDFVARTAQALDRDRSLGLAYTGMTVVSEHNRQLSDFPGGSGNLQKLTKGNFIPCANLFRKKAWQRAGGYKNINPSWEDYDLWLTIAEIGFGIKYVTQARLIYTQSQTGRTGEEQRGNHSKLLRATVDGYHSRLYGDAGRVSFIIPCYNQWEYLYEAVESAWKQTYPHLEVIVVDDASTTPEKEVSAVKNKILKDFPRTKFVVRPQNGGLSAARNTGLQSASGGWMVPLDADDKVAPEFVAECLKVVYNTGEYAYTDAYIWHNFGQGPLEELDMPTFNPDGLRTHHQHACTILVRTSWLYQIQGYDESMRDGWEDYECAIRLVKSGHCGKHVPGHLFYYRWRPDSMRQQAENKIPKINRYIWEKHADVAAGASLMACCGGNSTPVYQTSDFIPNTQDLIIPEGSVLLHYTGNKQGDMTKTGNVQRIYRYSALNPNLLVHEDDVLLFPGSMFVEVKRYQAQQVETIAEAPATPPIPELPVNEEDLTVIDDITAEKQIVLYANGVTNMQRLIAADDAKLALALNKREIKKVRTKAIELVRQASGV